MRLYFVVVLAACGPASKPIVELPSRATPSSVAASPPPEDAPRKGFDQSTPIAALRSFVRAYLAQRWDVLLSFAPNGAKEGLTPEKVEDVWKDDPHFLKGVDSIRRALAEGVEPTPSGDHAVFTHSRGVVTLVREDGTWKIEDFTD